MNIRTAFETDKLSLIALINKAYQVADFFKYEKRINEEEMDRYFSTGIFLMLEDDSKIAACIYYRLINNALDFSLLSTHPQNQGKGFGKLLIEKVEKIADENKCNLINIQVVNVRTELFAYYEKFGYVFTGIAPFPKATKIPCHLVNMSKRLKLS